MTWGALTRRSAAARLAGTRKGGAMQPNAVRDLYQIGVGLCAILGVFFLATGIIDDEKDTKVIAPLLFAIGYAVFTGGMLYYIYEDLSFLNFFPPPSRTVLPFVVAVGVLGGLVFGYFLGVRYLEVLSQIGIRPQRGTAAPSDQ